MLTAARAAAALLLPLALGCPERQERTPPGAPGGAPELKEARSVFASRCAICHGDRGEGDGPAAAGLKPQPANFRDPSWQAQVTDEHIEQVIALGGAAVGKSPVMPPNPDLARRPVVSQLRALIRTMRDAQ
jgi:mono/diheme cytochrome c family protein